MSVSQATLNDLAADGSPRKLTLGKVSGQILALAAPIALGALVTSVLNLGKIALLSHTNNPAALSILSLLQPAFILGLAFLESLAITNQVFSAKSKAAWPKRGVLKATKRLSLVGLGLFALVAGGAALVPYAITFEDAQMAASMAYLPLFILAMAPFMLFEIMHGALRGQGKILHGLIPFVALVAIDLGVTYWLVGMLDYGFEGVLIGTVAGPLAMLPVMAFLLHRQVKDGDELPDEAFAIRIKQLLFGVGAPVFLSTVIGFVSSVIIFPVLNGFGEEQASAFLVIIRLRIAFMIPAIAIGSAIAILVNQHEDGPKGTGISRYLSYGVSFMMVFYSLATLALLQWDSQVLGLMVPATSPELLAATSLMMKALLGTFFLSSAAVLLQVVLEQLGRGVHVMVITLVAEVATCCAVFFALYQDMGLQVILLLLVILAGASLALLLIQFILLVIKMERADAL